ncbi:XisH family protein [Scytonema hofmannii FACHB-248]|uniref:XisH family protein n=1 Tax=Scytonema hofmannii FACHB-248 TaxID=1842502 RepID=A0ABR8GN37_9CYAN|nr:MULTISPECIES: XisH family protein [Nostocales]MBD2604460.1 XisH family protein [Scytonema hofmannii FACHB-248]
MPAKDVYHQQVKNALIKAGWRITRDTYQIKFREIKLYADLAAKAMFAAEQDQQQIIVEVKSFLGPSRVRDFEAGLGQYILYRLYLAQIFPEAVLYMAVSDAIYRSFFIKSAIQFAVTELDIKLIVFDVEQEVIVQWIS